jgi:hypothetical protein
MRGEPKGEHEEKEDLLLSAVGNDGGLRGDIDSTIALSGS